MAAFSVRLGIQQNYFTWQQEASADQFELLHFYWMFRNDDVNTEFLGCQFSAW
jgi:hypothetical protein